MAEDNSSKDYCQRRREQRQAACALCTSLLVLLIVVLLILYFSLFKPKDPTVQVPTMQLVSFVPTISQSVVTSLNLTLKLQVAMYNPNRATFYLADGSIACLYYHGSQVGIASVPSVFIPSQSFSTLSVALTVQGLAPLQGTYLNDDVAVAMLPVSTSVIVLGSVTTLNTFSHHSDVISKCNVSISFNLKLIESYTCQRSYSLLD